MAQVDTELVYAYAKTEDMGALEEFMSGTHQANLQSVGDRVFDEGMFEAARAIFAHIPNWGRLASTLVRLHQFQQAVDAARKANSPKTWKEVRLTFALLHCISCRSAAEVCRDIQDTHACGSLIHKSTKYRIGVGFCMLPVCLPVVCLSDY